jgi:hypothetical protein
VPDVDCRISLRSRGRIRYFLGGEGGVKEERGERERERGVVEGVISLPPRMEKRGGACERG